jgi:hypothetical protein
MVCQALTDPALLSEWAPFDADRNLAAVGPMNLSTVGTPTPQGCDSSLGEARRLELNMRCGIHRGNSSLVTRLAQRVGATGESDIMSLSAARPKCLSSGRTTYPGIPPPKRNATPLRHAEF